MKKKFMIPSMEIAEFTTEHIQAAAASTTPSYNSSLAEEKLAESGAHYITTADWATIRFTY